MNIVRTMFWFDHLRLAGRCEGPTAVERWVEGPAALQARSGLYHRNHWYAYAKGLRTPQKRRRMLAAAVDPASLTGFDHVLWDALRIDGPLGRRTNRLLRATGRRIVALLFRRLPDGRAHRRRPVTKRMLREIESQPAQDALAALTILLREAAEKQDFELAQQLVGRILRVLLVYSTNSYAIHAAPLLYQLFLELIFPLAGGQGSRFDFEGYDFCQASRRLRDHLLWAEDTDRVQLKSGEEAGYLLSRLQGDRELPMQLWLMSPLFPGVDPRFHSAEGIKAWRRELRGRGTRRRKVSGLASPVAGTAV